MKIDYKNFQIELLYDCHNNRDSIIKSKNNQIYFGGEEKVPVYRSRHFIVLKEFGIEISNITIYQTNSISGIFEDTFIVEDDKIWVISGNTIYCLEIPSLKLIWHKEFDLVTNFSIHKLKNDFIIRGELLIFRISKEGEIIWSFGGRDIWFNPEGYNELTIEENAIRLFDFDSNEYVIDFDGNQIEDIPRVFPQEIKKKWWKIFG